MSKLKADSEVFLLENDYSIVIFITICLLTGFSDYFGIVNNTTRMWAVLSPEEQMQITQFLENSRI